MTSEKNDQSQQDLNKHVYGNVEKGQDVSGAKIVLDKIIEQLQNTNDQGKKEQ